MPIITLTSTPLALEYLYFTYISITGFGYVLIRGI